MGIIFRDDIFDAPEEKDDSLMTLAETEEKIKEWKTSLKNKVLRIGICFIQFITLPILERVTGCTEEEIQQISSVIYPAYAIATPIFIVQIAIRWRNVKKYERLLEEKQRQRRLTE